VAYFFWNILIMRIFIYDKNKEKEGKRKKLPRWRRHCRETYCEMAYFFWNILIMRIFMYDKNKEKEGKRKKLPRWRRHCRETYCEMTYFFWNILIMRIFIYDNNKDKVIRTLNKGRGRGEKDGKMKTLPRWRRH
jgi:uncharacterized membrane protein YsdA (DUF1294 family)